MFIQINFMMVPEKCNLTILPTRICCCCSIFYKTDVSLGNNQMTKQQCHERTCKCRKMLFASLLDAVACSCFEAASYDVGVEKCHKLSFFILGTAQNCSNSTRVDLLIWWVLHRELDCFMLCFLWSQNFF